MLREVGNRTVCASTVAAWALVASQLAGCGEPVLLGEVPEGADASAPLPIDAAAPEPEPEHVRVVRTEGAPLHVREAPRADADIVAQIPAGELAEVVGEREGSWLPVAYEGDAGWAHGDFLERLDGEEMLFLLPWTAGDAYRVSQGHHTGSHTGNGAWAWDFALPVGTPVRAAHAGTVRAVKGDSTVGGCDRAYINDGNYVVVDRGNGIESLYLHLDRVDSPDGGGTESWYNPSVDEVFYDTGEPWDPPLGAQPVSRNSELALP
jgi:hypothetical protein